MVCLIKGLEKLYLSFKFMFNNSNRGISTLMAIGIIAVLVIVIGGGVLGYQYLSSQKNNNQQQNQNQQQTPNNQTNNDQASITITSPKAGDVLTAGQTYSIAWTSSNLAFPNIITDIQLLSSNNTLVRFLASSINNTGSYSWTIDPNTPAGTYSIVIENGGALDENQAVSRSGSFTINSKTPAATAPTVNSLSPAIVYVDNSQFGMGGSVMVSGSGFIINGGILIHLLNASTGANFTDVSANTPSGNPTSDNQFSFSVPNSTPVGQYNLIVENVYGLKSQPRLFTVASNQSTSLIQYKTGFDGGSLYGSLYRSDDGGITWKEILRRYKSSVVYAVDSKNASTIYAGDAGFNMMGEGPGASLFKSTDKGETWTDISQNIRNQIGMIYGVSSISVDLNNSNIIKATVNSSTTQGINFTSTDYGNTWAKQSY